MDSVKASGPTTPATPRVDLQGNNPQAYMVHKKYPETILGPWGQTSLDIGIFSISFGMLVVGQDNFLFSCLGWVLQHPNCNPFAEATTRGPASVFTGTMWGAGLLHCHPNHSKHVHERSGFSCTSLLPSSKLGTVSWRWKSRFSYIQLYFSLRLS